MKQEQFDHAIRAAGAILGESEVIVIGSQAIFGTISENLPPEAEQSIEVDVAAIHDPNSEKSDLLDGSIGELSMFHDTFGIYAQGVSKSTAILPQGWEERLVHYRTPSTNGVTALCLEINDLWISKALANRDKDIEFCKALYQIKLVDLEEIKNRLQKVDQQHGAKVDHAAKLVDRLARL